MYYLPYLSRYGMLKPSTPEFFNSHAGDNDQYINSENADYESRYKSITTT